MSSVAEGLQTVNNMGQGGSSFHPTTADAWEDTTCGFCGAVSLFTVARVKPDNRRALAPVIWMRCPRCLRGCVVNDGIPSPSPLPFFTPEGVPQQEAALWEQARASLSVGAYSGAAMICRKLLLHIAYTHQRADNPDAEPFSNFAKAVQYLEDEHVILASHKSWVDQIRQLGNRANHELPDITADEATNIARFTLQLFINLYEMPFKADLSNPLTGEAANPYETPEDDYAPSSSE